MDLTTKYQVHMPLPPATALQAQQASAEGVHSGDYLHPQMDAR